MGTQQRSGKHFQEAKDIVQSGRLGTISFVRTWNYSNAFPEGIGTPPDTEPPAGLDWDMWLGPAPEREFNKNRFGVNPYSFAHFRWFWDYAGGMMTDWGIHLLDIVLWAMAEPGPRSISTYGGKYALTDNRETPDTIMASYEFPAFVCTYENRVANAYTGGLPGYGIQFHGTEGTLYVNRQYWEITPEQRRYREPAPRVENRMEPARGESRNPTTDDHWRDFVAAIRDRSKPICDIEIGHRSTAMALLGNVSMRSRQRVDWDPVSETTNNKEAQTYLRNEYPAALEARAIARSYEAATTRRERSTSTGVRQDPAFPIIDPTTQAKPLAASAHTNGSSPMKLRVPYATYCKMNAPKTGRDATEASGTVHARPVNGEQGGEEKRRSESGPGEDHDVLQVVRRAQRKDTRHQADTRGSRRASRAGHCARWPVPGCFARTGRAAIAPAATSRKELLIVDMIAAIGAASTKPASTGADGGQDGGPASHGRWRRVRARERAPESPQKSPQDRAAGYSSRSRSTPA